ncbi:MAG: helix-turn-helix domain-containing protein [Gammaproteobacteria bacterium]|uniref:Putative antitoxin n=1 Tax=viral metagenome TaxID=1070528 RepID=A0A6M3M7M1_9ZZZZ|nr:helix-turn-helix domain-containing protein [Gammaproteobacteria bacterium]
MNIFERLVKHFGTQDQTAAALNVKQGTVSGWVRGEHGMSAVAALTAEQVTDGAFKAVELCPALKRVKTAA